MFEAVCEAVGYAPTHRVLPRDLKPANVMVGDFGEEDPVAAADGQAPEMTRAWTEVSPMPEAGSHTLVGTPSFIPPSERPGHPGH